MVKGRDKPGHFTEGGEAGRKAGRKTGKEDKPGEGRKTGKTERKGSEKGW